MVAPAVAVASAAGVGSTSAGGAEGASADATAGDTGSCLGVGFAADTPQPTMVRARAATSATRVEPARDMVKTPRNVLGGGGQCRTKPWIEQGGTSTPWRVQPSSGVE